MLTRRTQIQAIADHLAGVANNRQFQLSDFEEPWQSVYRAVLEAPAGQGPEALRSALASRSDRDAILGAILTVVPGERPIFPSLREIAGTLPPIEWLWPNWIPRGMLTLLGAAPGAGKSFLALDLSRRIGLDEPFPDGAPQPLPGGNVIYVDAESVPQILSERAQLWQMDTSRLYLMRPEGKLYIDFGDPADRDHLVEMALHLEPALIVIDSLGSISSKGENNVEDVRDLLGFLNRLALDTQCGLLLIHHLRKRGVLPLVDVLTVDDFRGSSHIIAMSRSVLGLSIVQSGPEPDRNGPRRLEIVKSNLARYPEPLGMTFKPLHPKGAWIEYTTEPLQPYQEPDRNGPRRLEIVKSNLARYPEPLGMTFKPLHPKGVWIEYSTEPPQPYQEPTQAEHCAQWLLAALEDGSVKPKDLEEMAREQGFSRATLYRARALLGDRVGSTASRQNPRNEWCLVEEEGEEA